MDRVKEVLKRLGFSEKEVAVYLALLSLGPSPVRKVAEAARVNRGTTHDALRLLQKQGLVSYYHKKKHQYFIAEEPKNMAALVGRRREELEGLAGEITDVIPQLYSLYSVIEERPVVKYYEDAQGIRTILEDVLNTTEKLEKPSYTAYSSSNIRPHLYTAYPSFTEDRIARKVFARVIAIGPGGKEAGYDERRWLTKKGGAPTYTLIYAGKLAMISVKQQGTPHGVTIEDKSLFETQQLLFDWIWNTLGRNGNSKE